MDRPLLREVRKRIEPLKRRTQFQSPPPIPKRILEIKPTEGESVFESYFAILSSLVGTRNVYQKIVEDSGITRVEEVKNKNDNPNTSVDDKRPIIYFFEPRRDGSTHYRVYSFGVHYDERKKKRVGKWSTTDPYFLYQKQGSQGFCQMFAYFIATNDTDEFLNKEDQHLDSNELYNLHKHNTFQCLQKTIKLLEVSPTITHLICEQFEHIKYDREVNYGIPAHMTFADFFRDLKRFAPYDLNDYITSL